MTADTCRAEVTLEVPFHDVDMMGVVWHGHYAKYFEAVRTRLFDRIGYGLEAMKASGYAWPVIDLQVRYAQPMHYGQRIRAVAHVREYELRLRIAYELRDADTGQRLSRGHTVQVAVGLSDGEMCFECPDILLERLGVTRS